MNNIHSIDFSEFNNLETLDPLAQQRKFYKFTWFWPQLVSYISTWPIKIVDGRVDVKHWVHTNLANNPRHQGIYCLVNLVARSKLLRPQTLEQNRNYGALTPIFLLAYRRHHNLPYSAWPREHISLVVESELAQAMLYKPPELTRARLLELRQHGLTQQTGQLAGTCRNPLTTWRLYNMHNTELAEVPLLQQTMLTQIWLAHPQQRTPYMILDPENWDHQPEPLADTNIFTNSAAASKPQPSLPWQL